jgi:hypothetical protein
MATNTLLPNKSNQPIQSVSAVMKQLKDVENVPPLLGALNAFLASL